METEKNIFNEMQQSLPYDVHLQGLILPCSLLQALILLFSHLLAIYVSVPSLVYELLENRNCAYRFATTLVSEHSIWT